MNLLARQALRALAGLILVAGCGGDQTDHLPGVVVRDSAGVRIVENEVPLLAGDQCWTIDPTPAITLGRLDGPPEYLFVAPWAARLSDGRIAVLDRGNRELRLFSPDGEHLSSTGRKGEGPGEFVGSNSLDVVAGDTMVIWDGALKRLSVFDPEGKFVRTVDLKRPEPIQLSLGVVDLHTAMGSRLLESSDSAGLYILRSEVLLLANDGEHLVALDTIHEPRHSGENFSTDLPFAPRAFLTAGAGRAYVTRGAPYEVLVFRSDGSLLQIVRRPWTASPVTEENIQTYLEWTLGQGNRERQERWLPRREAAARLSDTKPAIWSMVPDRVGNLWVGRWADYGNPRTDYDVFDTDGKWLCKVAIPEELQMITEIGDDYVLGEVIDDLGVERVSLYSIHKPDSGRRRE